MKYNLVRSGPRQSSSVVRAPGIYLEAAWGPQFKSPSGPFSATAAGYITRDFSMYGVCRIYPIFFFFKMAHAKVYWTCCKFSASIKWCQIVVIYIMFTIGTLTGNVLLMMTAL